MYLVPHTSYLGRFAFGALEIPSAKQAAPSAQDEPDNGHACTYFFFQVFQVPITSNPTSSSFEVLQCSSVLKWVIPDRTELPVTQSRRSRGRIT